MTTHALPETVEQAAGPTPGSERGTYVVVSELEVEAIGAAGLEAAFRARLGEVDQFPGHLGLEVCGTSEAAGGT